MKTKDRMAQGIVRGVSIKQPDTVRCNIKPECEGCPFPAHGFICWSADGTCMKDRYQKKVVPPEPDKAGEPQASPDVCQA